MALTDLIPPFDATPEMLATVICVVLAASVLTQYTRIGGIAGFVINALLLFLGAFSAVYLTRGMDLPLGYFLQRTLLVSFGGILAISLLMLLLFSRSRRG